ncbi:hypothetical protein [Arenimonas sp. MALMAid1274]|uniref:hypothetical protein n=1 Tax=Arenimonas sp. MALMAid1274 TaxID=3411630 RepID=UPI003BA2845A
MNKTNSTAALAAAFALALSGAAFAGDNKDETAVDPNMAPPTSAEVTFEQLDTDADGYVAKTDIPAEHELSIQFAVADSNQDARLSRDEFDAYQVAPEEEEAEE